MSIQSNLDYFKDMTDAQVAATLRDLQGQAGERHHRRIAGCVRLLGSEEWVRRAAGGSTERAMALLEADYLGDLIGVPSLAQLMNCYTELTLAEWRELKFDFKQMLAEVSRRRHPEPRTKPRVHVNSHARRGPGEALPAPAEFEHLSDAQKRQAFERARTAAEREADESARLKAALADMEADRDLWKEKAQQLEKEVKQYRKAAQLFAQTAAG